MNENASTEAAADDALDPIHELAVEIARRAGEVLTDLFAGPLDVRYKSKRDKDPVTQADEAVETLVRERVGERFPDHGVIGEEGADRTAGARFIWVVDPLDGTANFANGLPIFATSIGVLRDGEPVVAALYTSFGPAAQPCVLHARRGAGLHIDGRNWQRPERTFSGRARLAGVPAGFIKGFRFGRLLGMPPGETRSLGSIAAELGLVASGALHYAVFASPRIWDVAGGVLLVTESGGAVFTDRRGEMMPLRQFEPPPGKSLREWKQAVVAGDAEAMRQIVPKLRVRHTPTEIAERLAGPTWSARARRFHGVAAPHLTAIAGFSRRVVRLLGAGLRNHSQDNM